MIEGNSKVEIEVMKEARKNRIGDMENVWIDKCTVLDNNALTPL